MAHKLEKVPAKALLFIIALASEGCATLLSQAPSESGAETDAKKAELAMLRGDQALRRGNVDQGLLEYVRALRWDPDRFEAHYMIGNIHSYKGNPALAEKAYRRVLDLSEGHAGAAEGLGLALLRQKKYDEADASLKRAVAADAKRWRAHNGLGVISDMRRDYSAAETHYLAALDVQPGMPMLLTNLGYSKYAAGDWSTAQFYFERALAQDQNHQKAWSNLGLLFVRRGQFGKAMDAFTKIMPEAQASNNVGYLCMMDGKYQLAEQYFVEAIRQSPSYNEAAYRNLDKVRALAESNAGPETAGPMECK
ncbi:MAG: tetratricopeptide repeat protein [Gammaproteobacteria bacterium]